MDGSRDENAGPVNRSYSYAKDSNGNAISGWRVFDVDEYTGEITLISAGCPEDYYTTNSKVVANTLYISEYILTGNVNEKANAETVELLGTTYNQRDWSMYVNETYATKAEILTKKRLDNWYTKYTNTPNANTYTRETFQKIYNTYSKYATVIDNYSLYWLVSVNVRSTDASSKTYNMDVVYPQGKKIDTSSGAAGLRVLVTLKPDIKLFQEKLGEITVVNPRGNGSNVTYNIWELK